MYIAVLFPSLPNLPFPTYVFWLMLSQAAKSLMRPSSHLIHSSVIPSHFWNVPSIAFVGRAVKKNRGSSINYRARPMAARLTSQITLCPYLRLHSNPGAVN